MKRGFDDFLPILISLFLVVMALVGLGDRGAYADTGNNKAERVAVGSAPFGSEVWCASHTVTQLIPPRYNRPDSNCVNISSYTIYIGSQAAGRELVTGIGTPVVSSQSANFGGLIGPVHCTTGGTDGRGAFRCWEGLTQ